MLLRAQGFGCPAPGGPAHRYYNFFLNIRRNRTDVYGSVEDRVIARIITEHSVNAVFFQMRVGRQREQCLRIPLDPVGAIGNRSAKRIAQEPIPIPDISYYLHPLLRQTAGDKVVSDGRSAAQIGGHDKRRGRKSNAKNKDGY